MGRKIKTKYRFPFASYPAVRILLLLAAGIILSAISEVKLPILTTLLMALLCVWLLSEIYLRKYSVTISSRVSTLLYLVILMAFGMIFEAVHRSGRVKKLTGSEIINLYAWEELRVTGSIQEMGQNQSGRTIMVLEAEKTELPNGKIWPGIYRVRIYSDIIVPAMNGNRLEATIKMYGFPERRNPHEFDYGEWLINRGITAHGELVESHKIFQKDRLGWASIRERVQKNIENLFTGRRVPLAKALFLGYKEELDPELKSRFARSGLSHIMAVSGLHVGFIVAPFWIIIPWFWGSKHGKIIGLILLTLLLTGYAGLTGFSASVCRASLMAWLLTYAKLFHKMRNSINLTATAAIILLLINPLQIRDIGFQLSFSAVFIILMIMPEIQRWIPEKMRYGKAGPIITIVLISVVVQLGLFPILVHNFGEFSIIGPLSNALVIPILSLVVPAGLMMSISGISDTGLFGILIIPIEYLLGWIEWVANTIGKQGFSFIEAEIGSMMIFPLWIVLTLLIAASRVPEMRWKILILLLVSANMMAADMLRKNSEHVAMELTFLDVGQADATHIVTPGGKHILVDAGRWSPFSNSGEKILIPYFEEMGIEKLDAIILTHPHSDHIGGVQTLINSLDIGAIYQSDFSYNSELYQNYMKEAESKGIPIYTPTAGDLIDVDPSIRIFVTGPEKGSKKPSNANNRSIAFKLVYGKESVLFTGDAEREQENQLARRYGDFLESSIYQAGHHGSNTSSSHELLRYVNPQYSVVSLAFENPFRHPGKESVVRLNDNSRDVSYTSLEGAVQFKVDGSTVQKTGWK